MFHRSIHFRRLKKKKCNHSLVRVYVCEYVAPMHETHETPTKAHEKRNRHFLDHGAMHILSCQFYQKCLQQKWVFPQFILNQQKFMFNRLIKMVLFLCIIFWQWFCNRCLSRAQKNNRPTKIAWAESVVHHRLNGAISARARISAQHWEYRIEMVLHLNSFTVAIFRRKRKCFERIRVCLWQALIVKTQFNRHIQILFTVV